MKRFILTMVVSLVLSGTMFSQTQTSHWPEWTKLSTYDVLNAFVKIDGAFVEGEDDYSNLELAAFVNDQCRYSAFMDYFPDYGDPYPIVDMMIWRGLDETGSTVTFKMYDHEKNIEYIVCTPNKDIVLGVHHKEIFDGDYDDGVILNFTTPSLEKEIVGYGTDYDPETNANAHYYLIASPVTGNVAPAQDNGFIPATGGYDLFYFDQTGDDNHNEWITYKEGNGATDPNFTLQNGKGYLYANEAGTTLHFEGPTHSGTEAPVGLAYDPSARWAGWNLVGNPFAKTAYPDRAYYALQNGSELSAEIANSTPVGAMEGIFVKSANAEDNSMTFTTTAPGAKRAALVMNVTRGRSLSDRAIVCFGGNEMLPKFQLRQNSTKVYIPVEGNDFAVVSAEAMGELPVNFRAETSGNYTLNFAAENVSFTYLHLIDNMTGANVDLLQTPFYSFDATTTDYASRFRLQFATGNSADGDTFGFFNEAGNLTIFGIEGTATLQVMDINGRILSTDTFSGSYEKQLNVAAGIYMLRLVNGNDVKVQKIVVR